jgi:hypothetical protein
MIALMDQVNIYGIMEEYMMVNGNKVLWMVMENICGQIMLVIKGIIRIIKDTEMVLCNGIYIKCGGAVGHLDSDTDMVKPFK